MVSAPPAGVGACDGPHHLPVTVDETGRQLGPADVDRQHRLRGRSSSVAG